MTDYSIRPFKDTDAAAAARIFYEAVHQGAAGHYDERQRDAWAKQIPETEPWRQRLRSQHTYVAEADSELIGFMTLDDSGHIDLAVVSPAWIGKGIARALYERIERHAIDLGLQQLTTEASHMARRHFERQGWSVVNQQTVERHQVSLVNFLMQKQL